MCTTGCSTDICLRLLKLPKRNFFLFELRDTDKSVWLEQVSGRTPVMMDLLRLGEYLRQGHRTGLRGLLVTVARARAGR